MTTLRFYFALRSPYSALATDLVLEAVTSGRYDGHVAFEVSPFSNANEQFLDPTSNPHKLNYMIHDLPRIYGARGLRLGLPDPFEVDFQPAAQAVMAAQDEGRGVHYLREVSMMRWSEGRNVAEPEVLIEAGTRVGVSEDTVREAIESPAWQERYAQTVAVAEKDGVFGVPFFVVQIGETREPFWGQDRWSMVQSYLDATLG